MWAHHQAQLTVGSFVLLAAVLCGWLAVRMFAWRRQRSQVRRAGARLRARWDASDVIAGDPRDIIRMTLLADVNEAGEVEKAEAWLLRHRDRLTYVSEQGGCGCCVVDWDLEGPRGIVETLPNSLRCDSEWTRGERPPNRP